MAFTFFMSAIPYTYKRPYVERYIFTSIGSTCERTKLYTRILKTYYPLFNTEFIITALIGSETKNRRVPFDPLASVEYLGFLIKRREN